VVVSWKLFWVSLGVAMSLAVAGGLVLRHIPWSWAVLVLAVLVSLGVSLTSKVVHGSHMFGMLPMRAKTQILRLLCLALGVHALWILVVVVRPRRWLVWLVVLLVLALVEYGVAHGHEYLLTKVAPRPKAKPLESEPEPEYGESYTAADALERNSDKTLTVFKAGLTQAGLGWLRVSSLWTPVHDFGVQFAVRVPSARTLAESRTAKHSTAATFGIESAEEIAKGLAEVLHHGLKPEWIGITRREYAGAFGVLVTTQDTMARLYPFEDTPEWTSVEEPALVGFDRAAEPYYLMLAQHGQDIGATTSGKTSLIHVKLAHETRCADAVAWVCGVEKLYDMLAGWIEPYRGSDLPLPIDYIAYGLNDVLELLAAAMRIVRYRQRQPVHLRRHWVRIIITLDEASFALKRRDLVVPYDGHKFTAAQMVAMLLQSGASAGVFLDLSTQRSTNSMFGDEGGDSTSQIGYSSAFRSRDSSEIGRLVGDYSLPMPRRQGAYWLDPGSSGELPVLLRSPYIQEIGADKKTLHTGATIADVAWARRHFHVELDEGSAAAAGEFYLARHTRMTPELELYLTGMPAGAEQEAGTKDDAEDGSVIDAMSDAEKRGYAAALAWVDELHVGQQDEVPDAQEEGPRVRPGRPSITVVRALPRGSRQDRILAMFNEHSQLQTSEIVEALRDQEADPTIGENNSVTNLLSEMVTKGSLRRISKGLYTRPGLSVVGRTG
jgi:hypothetical protein